MKFMEKLLVGEKVEWKKLGDLIEKYSEKAQHNKDIKKVYTISKDYGIIPSLEYWENKEQKNEYQIYSEDTGNYNVIRENMFAYNPARLNIGSIDCLFDKEPGLLSPMYVIFKIDEKKIMPNYLLLYLKSSKILQKIDSIKEPGARFRFDFERWNKIEIPLPSLKIQEEVIKKLSSFTKYITELQAELQARNKQYNYYRDMLLSEDYLNKISEKIYEIEENGTLALVPIKEVCIRQRGFSITASEMKEIHKDNAPIKIFAGGKTTANIDEYNIDKKYIIKKPSIIVKSRGNIDFEFYDNPFSHKNELWSYSSNDDNVLNIRYLYYYLKKNIKYSKDKAISGKLPQISTGITDNYKIWLPSIIIQNKIVKILDRFQELLSDTKGLLPLEIEQRRKQYEYYREKLLTFDKEEGYALSTAQHSTAQHSTAQRQITSEFFELLKEAAKIADIDISDKVEWKTLGEIGSFVNGSGMPKTMFDENGEIGAIHYGHIYTKYNMFVYNPIVKISNKNSKKLKKVKTGDLVIAKTSENIEDIMKTVAYLGDNEAVAGGHSAIFSHNQNAKYLSYVFNGYSELIKQKNKIARGVKVIEISVTDMEKIKIPLPSLEAQKYIVSILDKFDTLVNDLSQGLPREIELRQKQYEYYREKLLNFEK